MVENGTRSSFTRLDVGANKLPVMTVRVPTNQQTASSTTPHRRLGTLGIASRSEITYSIESVEPMGRIGRVLRLQGQSSDQQPFKVYRVVAAAAPLL